MNQKMYVAGAFGGEITDTAWFVEGHARKQPDPHYTCNAEETDTRLWLHVKKTPYSCILVMSPDTDVYNIGLSLQSAKDKQVFVQVSSYNARELKFVLLNNLYIHCFC